jgi:hypothetical protein
VLYISDIDLSFLTRPVQPGVRPLPETTSAAMTAVPFAFVGMGALMSGLYWICRRRDELGKLKQENEE